jgi:polyisoprenoid-binding protein YceI
MHTKPDHITTTPQFGRYEIDTTRSAVTFRTRHLFGLAPVRGTFAIRSGTIDIAEPLADSRVRVEIGAASFHTGNRPRDNSVRSARLLDASQYPVLTFTGVHVSDDALAGSLTVRDTTQPVSLSIVQFTPADQSFTARATTRIDRTGFGVTAYRGLAGRYLDICVEVCCVRS